ncbi:hillarin-like [Mercenaria mercenaria]|uniref:hillarin-like n=1 Tax=Mercenaria mercenaria TaxID=6596 RepID=UPI00234FA518|nr:hillarin-like [Mercenaria mercenaria]
MENISKVHSYDEEAISFYNIDKHVSQINFSEMESVEDVLDYIKKPIAADDEHRNIYLARSILRLMYVVQIIDDVPVMFSFELLFPSFTTGFDRMCSRLDIPCRIIRGKSKDFTYRHNTVRAEWCAFMSAGVWFLLHPDFMLSVTTCCRETEGRIILERDGKTVLEQQQQTGGQTYVDWDEFWFCTKPNIFATYHYPDDQEWLLLENLKTSEDIKSMTFAHEEYHNLGLQFLTERASKVYAKDGRCTISLKVDSTVLRNKRFPYVLSLIEGTGDISGIDPMDLPLLVRYAPGIDTLSFNIRFPVSGEYVFEVSVTELDNDDIRCGCFDVVIVCNEADPNCRKLPIDAGIVGFGYGHTAKEAGLKNPSKADPSVYVSPATDDDPTVLTFQIEGDHIDEIEYGSDIRAEGEINASAETHVDPKKGKLTIIASVKADGEYALSLTAKPKQSSDKPDTVLIYLLTTDKHEDDVEKLMKKRKHDLILEGKMEKRITMKNVLTKKISAIEKELLELRKFEEEGVNTTLHTTLGDHDDGSDCYNQSKKEVTVDSAAVTAAGINDDNVTENVPFTKAENVSTVEIVKNSKTCHLM